MGGPNPDRISLVERRHHGETVADMWKSEWKCRAVCERCGVALRVNLDTMIRLNGPGLSLWNKTTACKVVGCPGRMFFQARPPYAPGWDYLGRPPRVRRPHEGPMAAGPGDFVLPEEIEPAAVTKARGPSPPHE
jgi:hypothetical protein